MSNLTSPLSPCLSPENSPTGIAILSDGSLNNPIKPRKLKAELRVFVGVKGGRKENYGSGYMIT